MTPTLTEGQLAAAAAGTAKYSHYFPTVEECKRAVDNKEVANCVAPDSIKQITRPEWAGLFPDTDFYVIGLLGHDEVTTYDHSYRRDLVAWQDGQYYDAESFDRLLAINNIKITEENRQLIAKAFALMTIPGYLADEITFLEWKEGNWPTSYNYDRVLKAWTKIQGLEIWWWFDFEDGRLRAVTRSDPNLNMGNYLVVPFEVLPFPRAKDYEFFGGTK